MDPIRQEIASKVEAFQRAALELYEFWEKHLEDEQIDSLLSAGYPLRFDFQEEVFRISEWCRGVLRRLPDNSDRELAGPGHSATAHFRSQWRNMDANSTPFFSRRGRDGCDETYEIHGPDGVIFSLPFWECEIQARRAAEIIVAALNQFHDSVATPARSLSNSSAEPEFETVISETARWALVRWMAAGQPRWGIRNRESGQLTTGEVDLETFQEMLCHLGWFGVVFPEQYPERRI